MQDAKHWEKTQLIIKINNVFLKIFLYSTLWTHEKKRNWSLVKEEKEGKYTIISNWQLKLITGWVGILESKRCKVDFIGQSDQHPTSQDDLSDFASSSIKDS